MSDPSSQKEMGIVVSKAMGQAFAHIAYGQARKGKTEIANETFTKAKSVAYGQKDALSKDLVLREIAYRQAECGFFDDSLKTIYEMEYSENKNWAVSRLAFEHIKHGQRKQAKKLAKMITDEAILCPLLSELADYEFTEGRFCTASATILVARMKARNINNRQVRQTAFETLDDIEKDMHCTLQTMSKSFYADGQKRK